MTIKELISYASQISDAYGDDLPVTDFAGNPVRAGFFKAGPGFSQSQLLIGRRNG